MKNKIAFFVFISFLFVGCAPTPGEKETPCSNQYKACMDDCKIITESDSDFQKSLCSVRCQMGYGVCSELGTTIDTIKDVGETIKKKYIDKTEE